MKFIASTVSMMARRPRPRTLSAAAERIAVPRPSVAVTMSGATTLGTMYALLFPIINFVNINTTNETVEQLRAAVAPFIDAAANLRVSVDGDPLSKFEKSPEKYRILSAPFSVTLPPDNLFGADAGTYSPAIDDGFYVMLKPLPVGHHTLHFSGEIPTLGFSVDVTYRLEVVPTSLE
jgi:hypothetical protein